MKASEGAGGTTHTALIGISRGESWDVPAALSSKYIGKTVAGTVLMRGNRTLPEQELVPRARGNSLPICLMDDTVRFSTGQRPIRLRLRETSEVSSWNGLVTKWMNFMLASGQGRHEKPPKHLKKKLGQYLRCESDKDPEH